MSSKFFFYFPLNIEVKLLLIYWKAMKVESSLARSYALQSNQTKKNKYLSHRKTCHRIPRARAGGGGRNPGPGGEPAGNRREPSSTHLLPPIVRIVSRPPVVSLPGILSRLSQQQFLLLFFLENIYG